MMKLVFSSLDLLTTVNELNKIIVGSRVNNIYDINNKTYLIKLSSGEEKFVLLLESGSRIHITEYEWTKNPMPSGFSMKLRKHIRNKKISHLQQLGLDRIVDIQFGFHESAHHLVIELYDKGNMFLTDYTYTILHLLRPRTDANQDVRYAAHEKYPIDLARPIPDCLCNLTEECSIDRLASYVHSQLVGTIGPWTLDTRPDNSLRPVQKVLASEFPYGQATIEHCCRCALRDVNSILLTFIQKCRDEPHSSHDSELEKVLIEYARHWALALRALLLPKFNNDSSGNGERGFIFGKKQSKEDNELSSQDDFHPFLFEQYRTKPHIAFPTFNKAVDAFFSKIESHKTTEKLAQNELKANKKLENIKRDHELRLSTLKADQEMDVRKAQLLESNRVLVDSILLMVNHALSNQLDWGELEKRLAEAKTQGDPLASHVVQLNLQYNQITIHLSDPFETASDQETSMENTAKINSHASGLDIVVDLDLNALNNARKYYDRKRAAMKKEEKTLIASRKALKSAAFKAQQTRKDVKTLVQISKVRKSMWFEKFFWFVSSENYLVVAGRDAQQNEALVKRHLGPEDIYVHADLHGASSVVVKARPLLPDELGPEMGTTCSVETSQPPCTSTMPLPSLKTLNEAGTMAIVLSSAWNARVVTSAWWVRADQVSKTAPSGEYLTTGAFMIRGRKNYLPPCHFVYGFGILFKLDEDSVPRHKGERRVARAEVVEHMLENAVPDGDSGFPERPPDALPDDGTNFPDAQLRLDLMKTVDKTKQKQKPPKTTGRDAIESHSGAVDDRSRSGKQNSESKKSNETSKQTAPSNPSAKNNGPLKRGQKSKLKKIKQKYGEQDEDERHMRMKLLQGESAKLSQHHERLLESASCAEKHVDRLEEGHQSANEQDDVELVVHTDSAAESDQDPDKPAESGSSPDAEHNTSHDNVVNPEIAEGGELELEEEEEEEEEERGNRSLEDNWLHLMDTFTGKPCEDDVLLYALPVCGPYSALSNYKFKVKLTPGTAKRGKAAKTALHCFLTDKTATGREKELIRVMKSEDVSRNFPGSVKVALAQGKTARPK